MKKIIYLVAAFTMLTFVACDKNDTEINSVDSGMLSDNIIITSENGEEPTEVTQKRIFENPEIFVSEDNNSELYKSIFEEGGSKLKAVNIAPYTAQGYDVKQQISSYQTTFPFGYMYDNRIFIGVVYIVNVYQYKKIVSIPKNASMIIPDQSVMVNYSNMGFIPGYASISKTGYSYVKIGNNGSFDSYYLITEVREITHNVLGQQIASTDNPVRMPYKATNPSGFVFKYFYQTEIEW